MKVLIVEDNEEIAETLSISMNSIGYDHDIVGLAELAVENCRYYEYDCIILDIMLPGDDGFTALKQMRKMGVDCPIVILSGMADDASQIKGLEEGADLYLTKPIEPALLISNIKAAARRERVLPGEAIRFSSNVYLDVQNKSLVNGEKKEKFTKKEFRIFSLLAKNLNRIMSHDRLIQSICYENALEEIPNSEVIRVHMCSIRKKMRKVAGSNLNITNERAMGYALRSMYTALNNSLTA